MVDITMSKRFWGTGGPVVIEGEGYTRTTRQALEWWTKAAHCGESWLKLYRVRKQAKKPLYTPLCVCLVTVHWWFIISNKLTCVRSRRKYRTKLTREVATSSSVTNGVNTNPHTVMLVPVYHLPTTYIPWDKISSSLNSQASRSICLMLPISQLR